MVISMTTGMNTDVYNYMFGSILAMSGTDVQLSMVLSLAVLVLYLFFYNKIFAITFDETFALATGVRSNLYNTLIDDPDSGHYCIGHADDGSVADFQSG